MELDDINIAEFQPVAFQNEGCAYTEMILVDCCTVWTQWGKPELGHAVDLGYDLDGNLVGIRIWDNVLKRG